MVNKMDKKHNITQTLETINNVVVGGQKLSNVRLTAVDLIMTANDKKFMSFNYQEKKDSKVLTLAQLNKIENKHIRYFVAQYQNYLGVEWVNSDKDQKAKIEALKDSIVATIPIILEEAREQNKKGQSLVGANNSKMLINGEYVFDNYEALNKNNTLDQVPLNFSEIMRVARAYYKNKNLGGSTKTKDNALDSSIKRLTVMINRDQENDCDSSSQWTRDNMIKLTSACNNYISTLKKLQEGATTKEHQEKRKTA